MTDLEIMNLPKFREALEKLINIFRFVNEREPTQTELEELRTILIHHIRKNKSKYVVNEFNSDDDFKFMTGNQFTSDLAPTKKEENGNDQRFEI